MPGARKYIEVLIFVVLWMAAGWVFHLDTIAYLLFGVPLVVLFQLFISRRSLWNLWVRDATTFRLSLIGIVIAALLILAPGYDLFFDALPKKSWMAVLWLLFAMAGAVFAAFALSRQRASATRQGLPSFVAALLIGISYISVTALAEHHSIGLPFPKLAFFAQAVLALLYGVLCAGGGRFSRRSRFACVSTAKRWSGERFALAFSAVCLQSMGRLAFTHARHYKRIGSCRGNSRSDHCSYFNRSASFLLLAGQRYFSPARSGPCCD